MAPEKKQARQICRALRLCKRRWPKAPPRGALGEYAVSPRSDLRSPASLPAATRWDPAFTKQPSPQPFLQPSNNHSNYNPTTTQPSFESNPRTIPTQPSIFVILQIRLNHNHNHNHNHNKTGGAADLPRPARGQGAGDGLRHGVREGEPAFDGEAADGGGEKDALSPP